MTLGTDIGLVKAYSATHAMRMCKQKHCESKTKKGYDYVDQASCYRNAFRF